MSKTWTAIIIIAILVIAGVFFFGSSEVNAPTDGVNNEDTTAEVPAPGSNNVDEMIEPGDTSVAAVISYTSSGFSPKEITVGVGDTVRFVNEGGGNMWVASAMHPTHTVYPGSDIEKCDTGADIFDQCRASGEFEFTFNETGEWAYHNHMRASHFGKVIVTEQ